MIRDSLAKRILVQGILLVCLPGLVNAQDNPCSEWARAILQELDSMVTASGPDKGECVARGLTEKSDRLFDLGFTLQNPPYSTTIISLGVERYHISLQAMEDMQDRQEKIVQIDSSAAAKLPKAKIVSVPEGKIQYTLGMNYDLREQLGVASRTDIFGKIRSFVDLVVWEPQKFASHDFPYLQRKDTSLQLVYKGNSQWRVSSQNGEVGPLLTYKNYTWSTSPAPQPEEIERGSPDIKPSDSKAYTYVQEKVGLHVGDALKEETIMGPVVMLTLSSSASVPTIFEYYESTLKGKGWKTSHKVLQNGDGALEMAKGGQKVTVTTANDAYLKGDSVSLYTLIIMGN